MHCIRYVFFHRIYLPFIHKAFAINGAIFTKILVDVSSGIAVAGSVMQNSKYILIGYVDIEDCRFDIYMIDLY